MYSSICLFLIFYEISLYSHRSDRELEANSYTWDIDTQNMADHMDSCFAIHGDYKSNEFLMNKKRSILSMVEIQEAKKTVMIGY